ncbi:MAG: hypothetical protein MUC88_00445 [Planctomycetes bacterium]|jgi:hypothetical protein|nr:hypothetical protein [Planctomycetota bacterium]
MDNQNQRALSRFKGAIQSAHPESASEAAIMSGSTMMAVQTDHVTALSVQQPRDLPLVAKRVEQECGMFPEGLVYAWQTKNKDGSRGQIEGPSIKMAMILARSWGNCFASSDTVGESVSHWRIRGKFVDYETGFNLAREYLQRKPSKGMGRMDEDRVIDINFQVGQSKAQRNAIVNAMPAGLVKMAMDAAKKAIAQGVKKEGGVHKAVEKVKKAFAKYSVTIEMLEQRVGKKAPDWSEEDVADIRAIYTALEDGQTTAANEFETVEQGKAALLPGGAPAATSGDEPPPLDDDGMGV